MNEIDVLCEQVIERTKMIHGTAEKIAEINQTSPSTALLMDEIALDDYEVLQSLVIALGEVLLPAENHDNEDEAKKGEGVTDA